MNSNVINNLLEEAYAARSYDIFKSIELANKALTYSEKINDTALTGKCLSRLSLFCMIISDFEKSNEFSERAIACFKEVNDHLGIAGAKYNLGSVLYKSNNHHGGLLNLLEALSIYKTQGDLGNQSKVEKAVGTIYGYIGDDYNAFKTYVSAIRNARKLSDKNLESNVLNNLSGLLLKRGRLNLAMRMIKHSIKLKKETNDIRGLGFAIYGRGKVYLETGFYQKAEKDFLDAYKIHKDTVEMLGCSMVLCKLGKLYYKLENFDKADEVLKEGLRISIDIDATAIKLKNYHLLHQMYKTTGNITESLKYLELYIAEKEVVMNNQTLKVIENYELINQMNILENQSKIQKEKQKVIDKKNADEKEAVKQKQKFLSIMSHEIRTPLNAITTIISLLEGKMKAEDKELFNSLQFASNNLITIVNDILDFTKLDSDKSQVEASSTNLASLCSNVVNLHSENANNKGLSLILENGISNTRNYFIDQPKISQILGNLVSNAIKFTSKGHVVLSTKLINESSDYDEIRFSVKDTGEGISEENLAVIFDSFSQVKPITTRSQGGTGLGLAIVKKLVSLHGSEIFVESEPNYGSEFYFTVKFKKSYDKVIKDDIDFNKLKGKRALIVEDTDINAMLMKRVLLKWGIESDHAVNGEKAVEAAKLLKYDFILMDIHMPIMNGYEATKIIKSQNNKNTNTPIFAVTADVLTSKDENSKNLFDAILWKPIEIEKLFLALLESENVMV